MGKLLAYTVFVIYALIMVMDFAAACQGHDSPCMGRNGSRGNCCRGMYCQITWSEGRCFYNSPK